MYTTTHTQFRTHAMQHIHRGDTILWHVHVLESRKMSNTLALFWRTVCDIIVSRLGKRQTLKNLPFFFKQGHYIHTDPFSFHSKYFGCLNLAIEKH